jgi:hypothetical protein
MVTNASHYLLCREEWAVELVSDFDLQEFQACLERSRIKFVSSEKVSGMQQLLFCAEQVCSYSGALMVDGDG